MVSCELQELMNQASRSPEARISEDDVIRLAGSLTNWEFYNTISLQIARKYTAGEISYTLADGLMNNLYFVAIAGVVVSDVHRLPSPFDEIYYAFDAGEFSHKRDRSDDPVVEFTDPLLAALLLKYAR